MPATTPLPLELSGLDGAHFDELRPHLERLASEPEHHDLEQVLSALLLDRCLRLLRRGARREIAEEALALSRFLESPPGETLRAVRPELHGSWASFADLLAEAAGRSAPDAIDSILRNHKGRGQQVLELLAEEASPVRRSRLRERLGEISESQLSHLLRDLEECELIVRHRPEGSKEVFVELGAFGRERVAARPAVAERPKVDHGAAFVEAERARDDDDRLRLFADDPSAGSPRGLFLVPRAA